MADEFTKAALYGIKTFNKKVKEKIGMMKLIELLNEYEIKREREFEGFKRDRLPYYEWSNKELGDGSITYLWLDKEDYKGEELIGNSANAVLISKHYGFIEWLVENDKIDRDKVKEEYQYMEYEPFDYMEYFFKKDGWLIMLLSISDTPIEDLISYLK